MAGRLFKQTPRSFLWLIAPFLWTSFLLATTALTCGEIERRTESIDPMYQEDEVDVMVDYGATLQEQERQAQSGGPEKVPAADDSEAVPDLGGDDSSGGDSTGGDTESQPEPEPIEDEPITQVAGTWHSPIRCDDGDGAYLYRWQVSLSQTGDQVSGTINFHDCPGGGRAEYRVEGRATREPSVFLDGTKTSGRGGLYSAVPAAQTFQIDPNGPPFPNFAP